MQLSTPLCSAISFMLTGTMVLLKIFCAVSIALLSVSTPNTDKNIACSVFKNKNLYASQNKNAYRFIIVLLNFLSVLILANS